MPAQHRTGSNLPVAGDSEFLGYLERHTNNVRRIAASDMARLAHAYFVRIPMLGDIGDRADSTAPAALEQQLLRYKDQLSGNEQYRLILDYSHEGPAFNEQFAQNFINIHGILHACEIAAERVVFLQHNRALTGVDCAYAGWFRRNGVQPMRVFYAQWWLLDQAASLNRRFSAPGAFAVHQQRLLDAFVPEAGQKTHRFLSFNYFPRFHRVLLLLWLLEQDLMKEGLVSFPGFRIPEMPIDFMQDALANIGHWRMGGRLSVQLARLQALSPLRVDSDAAATKQTLAEHFVHEPFIRSVFSVVTDTGFSNGLTSRRITEKFLKPILHGHPFLIVGEPRSLEEIRRLGFRTFEPYFDESYDLVQEPEQRLERIFANIRGKCRHTLADLIGQTRDLLPLLQHNMQHAVYGLSERLRAESEYPLLAHLLRELGLADPHPPAPVAASRAPLPVASDDAWQPMAVPRDLSDTKLDGAVFSWAETYEADGRVYRILRDDTVDNPHRMTLRLDRDLTQPHQFHIDVRAMRVRRARFLLKSPQHDIFRSEFDFRLGVFTTAHNVEAPANVATSATYLDSGWFALSFIGQVGFGPGPLDIVVQFAERDKAEAGDGQAQLWLSNIALLRGQLAPEPPPAERLATMLERARGLRAERQWAEAEHLLGAAVLACPAAAAPLVAWGLLSHERTRWADMADRFAVLRSRFPDHCFGYSRGGEALRWLRRFEEAETVISAGFPRFASEPELLVQWVRVACDRAAWPQAEQRAQALFERAGTVVRAYSVAAEPYGRQGKYDEAETILETGVLRAGAEQSLMRQLAELSERRGDWAGAARRWAALCHDFPHLPACHLGLVRTLRRSHCRDAAETARAAAAGRFPDSDEFAPEPDGSMKQI